MIAKNPTSITKTSQKQCRCGFLFLTPTNFDEMGTDLHDCLRTFELHPTVGLPRRPAHVKSVMRLRPPPRRESASMGTPDGVSRVVDGGATEALAVERGVGGDRAAGGGGKLESCEHAQHLAWFLLTSACLSKVIRGWGWGWAGARRDG